MSVVTEFYIIVAIIEVIATIRISQATIQASELASTARYYRRCAKKSIVPDERLLKGYSERELTSASDFVFYKKSILKALKQFVVMTLILTVALLVIYAFVCGSSNPITVVKFFIEHLSDQDIRCIYKGWFIIYPCHRLLNVITGKLR